MFSVSIRPMHQPPGSSRLRKSNDGPKKGNLGEPSSPLACARRSTCFCFDTAFVCPCCNPGAMIDRWQGSFDTVIWKEPSNEAGRWSRAAEEGIWKEDTSNQAGGSQVVREGMQGFPWVPDESRAVREVLYSTLLALGVILRGRTKYRGHAGGFHGSLLGWRDSIRS